MELEAILEFNVSHFTGEQTYLKIKLAIKGHAAWGYDLGSNLILLLVCDLTEFTNPFYQS